MYQWHDVSGTGSQILWGAVSHLLTVTSPGCIPTDPGPSGARGWKESNDQFDLGDQCT